MKSNIQEKGTMSSNIKIQKSLTKKYNDTNLFSDKLKRAKEHFKNRDVLKEINDLEKKEKIKKV